MTRFDDCMDVILPFEGGLSMDRRDPGNWTGGKVGKGELRGTNMGIAAHAHPGEDIQGMTAARAKAIYRQKYAAPIRFDDLPAGIDLATLDPAINSGPPRGVRWMQQGLGIMADGVMGPVTIKAARGANPVEAVQRACAARMGFLRGLKIWATYKNGWSRRVAAIEAAGVRMALAAHKAPVREALAAEAKRADTKAKTEAGKATGGAVAGGGGISIADMPDWGFALAVALVVALVVIIIGQMRHERERAAAYGRESNA